MLDEIERRIVNELQRGFPISERPYADMARELGTTETNLIARLQCLLDDGVLTRFGPLYHAERMGGGLTLAAMSIPEEDFDRVTAIVNALPEVAHNYARDHALNMWFVLATETPGAIENAIATIERESGYPVYNMPKQEEFYVGLHFAV